MEAVTGTFCKGDCLSFSIARQSGSARRLFGFLCRSDLTGISVEAMDSAVADALANDLERTRGEL